MFKLTAAQPSVHSHTLLLCADSGFLKFAWILIDQIARLCPNLEADICLVSDADILVPKSMANLNVRTCKLEIDQKLSDLPQNAHVNLAGYYRLFAVEALSNDYEKLLYLDSDIMFQGGDLDKFLNAKLLSNHAIGAVRDHVQQQRHTRVPQDGQALGIGAFPYFNSGVMLVDTVQWKRQNILARCMEAAERYGEHFMYNDQSALNLALRGEWSELSWNWNWVYREKAPRFVRKHPPSFLHFAGADKPWQLDEEKFPRWIIQEYRSAYMKHFNEQLTAPADRNANSAQRAVPWLVRAYRSFLYEYRFWKYARRFPDDSAAIDPWSLSD